MPESPPVRRLGAAAPFDSSVDEATWLSTSPLKRSVLLTHILPDRSTPPGGSAGAVRVRLSKRLLFPDAGQPSRSVQDTAPKTTGTGVACPKWSTENAHTAATGTRLPQPVHRE